MFDSSQTCSALAGVGTALLSSIACWAMTIEDIDALFGPLPRDERRKLHTQMNRDLVRIAMLLMAHRALHTGEAQCFSLRQLSRHLDAPRADSMQRSLRNWVLPMLDRAGWIEGFVLTEAWSTEPHEIQITAKGLAAVDAYLRRCTHSFAILNLKGDHA